MTDHHQACCNPYTVWRACSGLSTGLHCTVPVPATSLYVMGGCMEDSCTVHCTWVIATWKYSRTPLVLPFVLFWPVRCNYIMLTLIFLCLMLRHWRLTFSCTCSETLILSSHWLLYDNFFPQIRTHSQISTLPDLGLNVKQVSLSKSVTPSPLLFHYFIY